MNKKTVCELQTAKDSLFESIISSSVVTFEKKLTRGSFLIYKQTV